MTVLRWGGGLLAAGDFDTSSQVVLSGKVKVLTPLFFCVLYPPRVVNCVLDFCCIEGATVLRRTYA